MGNHLFGLVGKSPAVLTEALWALAYQLPDPVLIDSVALCWTEGTLEAANKLYGPGGGLAQLKADYPERMPWPVPAFSAENDVIAVADVTSPREAQKAADAIYSRMRTRFGSCGDDDAVHVVMAGGRKTMASYAMAAFQLLARPGDHLWHVAMLGEKQLPAAFLYPRPGAPQDDGKTFALHEVPCLLLGRLISAGALDLDRPFSELVADLQHRMMVYSRPELLTIDLEYGRVEYKGVSLELRKRKVQAALLALLALRLKRGEQGGWVVTSQKGQWALEQAYQLCFLRAQGDLRAWDAPVAEQRRVLEHEHQLPAGNDAALAAKLTELAGLAMRNISDIDNVVRSAGLDSFFEKRQIDGLTCRRIALPPQSILLRLPAWCDAVDRDHRNA